MRKEGAWIIIESTPDRDLRWGWEGKGLSNGLQKGRWKLSGVPGGFEVTHVKSILGVPPHVADMSRGGEEALLKPHCSSFPPFLMKPSLLPSPAQRDSEGT